MIKGEKFGNWTIIDVLNDNGTDIICQCKCGNIKTTKTYELKKKRHNKCEKCRHKDYSNQKYNHILIKSHAYNRRQNSYWNCVCDCGKEFIRTVGAIVSNRIKSCGCLQHSEIKRYEDITYNCFNRIKNQAKRRNIQFDISIEDIWEQYQKQKGLCALSGIEVYFSTKYPNRDPESGSFNDASVDRIDSTQGYTKDNIQIVHKHINWMKNDTPQGLFVLWCYCVANHNMNKKCQ